MKALTVMIKPASGLCNMRCRYCFYSDVTDLRAVKSYGMMSRDALERIVEQALAEATELCAFAFQGGEPTLAGLDFFRFLLAAEKKHNKNKVKITHAIQTNGLLLDDEWCEFLAKNQFLVGLSLDAGKQTHDELRLDAARKGTHSRVMKAARLLTKHGAEFNILSVVTKQLAAHPDRAWQFYKREGFRYLQFIPCLDGLEETPGASGYSLDAARYGDFLCRVFDLWYEDYTRGEYISVRQFDNYVHMLMGHPPENCAMAGSCAAYPLIEADGSVYPCDFYALDAYRLGNVATDAFAEMLGGEAAMRFREPTIEPHPDCAGCEHYPICRGGCRRDREPMGETLPLNRYCEAYKRFFAHALPRMREVARGAMTRRQG